MESRLVLSLVESHPMISSKIKGKVDNVAFVECVYCVCIVRTKIMIRTAKSFSSG